MDTPILSSVLDILLVVGCVAASMTTLAVYQRLAHPDPEVVRKLMHLSSGVLAASFPWIFDAVWPVLVVCSASLAGMISVRYVRPLAMRCGSVLGGVTRRSLGEMYFPVAVGFLYVVSAGDRVLYVAPILVMTFADTAAALAGGRFGLHCFRTRDGRKSVEGSAAFLLTALPCVALPMAVWTNATLDHVLYTSILAAAILTVVEAGSWGGLDNLAVPAIGLVIVRASLGLTVEDLAAHTQAAVVMIAAMSLFTGLTVHRLRTVAVRGAGFYWLPIYLVLALVCLELVQSETRTRHATTSGPEGARRSLAVQVVDPFVDAAHSHSQFADGIPSASWR